MVDCISAFTISEAEPTAAVVAAATTAAANGALQAVVSGSTNSKLKQTFAVALLEKVVFSAVSLFHCEGATSYGTSRRIHKSRTTTVTAVK